MTESGTPFSLRATPRLIWVVCGLVALLGLGYAVLVPLLHGPDEGAHIDRIANAQDIGEPDPTATYSPDLLEALGQVNIVAVDHRVAPVVPWQPLDPEVALGADRLVPFPGLAPPGQTGKINPAGTGPPFYYGLISASDDLRATFGAGGLETSPWRETLAFWRLLSAVLLAPLPLLTYWTARALGLDESVGVLAALSSLAVPQLGHSAGMVNNDALLLPAMWIVTLATALLLRDPRNLGVLVMAGLAAGVGLATKVFALGGPIWIATAVLLGVAARTTTARGDRTPGSVVLRSAMPLAVAGGAAFVAGGWWPVLQFIRAGSPAPRGFNYPQPETVETSVITWVSEVVERLASTGFGKFGIEQFGLPGWLVVAASATVLVLTFVGAQQLKGQLGLPAVAVCLVPATTTLAMTLVAAWGGYVRSGLPTGLHGRYLFVALPGLMVLAALGLQRLARSPRVALGSMAASILVMQAFGLWVVLRNYWPGSMRDQVRTAMVSSGHSDVFLGVAAIAAATLLALLLMDLSTRFRLGDAPAMTGART